MSMQFLGTQIDAVYHTSIVLDGIEYYFGQGVQTSSAGATHHGRPMEVIKLGQTALPIEVILEYLESLKEIYTAEVRICEGKTVEDEETTKRWTQTESIQTPFSFANKLQSYDLFMHNCNNFSNDFAMFLVGKGIPAHITSLPQTVLNTPFGQMLKPQIDAAMRPITQAPTLQPVNPQSSSVRTQTAATPAAKSGSALEINTGRVNNITTLKDVDRLLGLAKDRCAIIFFTSATCAPCKLVYQPYDDLAAEAGTKCVFIKIDFTRADRSVSTRYPDVRATPTFITYLRGEKQDEWSGADPRQLRSNVDMLINAAFPPHPHLDKSTPMLLRQSLRSVRFTKVPPLEKLVAKMGESGRDEAVSSIVSFIQAREQSGAIEAPLTGLPQFAEFLRNSTSILPPELLFTALDLLRVSLIDVRVAGWFAEEHKGMTPEGIQGGLSP
jgi:thiol-disulfide isomerase/thioredoxin